MASNVYSDLVETIKVAYDEISLLGSNEDCQRAVTLWQGIIQNTITSWNNILTGGDRRVAVNERRSIQSNIVLLHSYYNRLSEIVIVEEPVVGGALDGDNNVGVQLRWQELENAFNTNIRTGCVLNIAHKDINRFLSDAKTVVIENVQRALNNHGGLKVYTVLSGRFENVRIETIDEEIKTFQSRSVEIFPETPLNEWYDELVEILVRLIEDFEHRDSGWSLREIDSLLVHICRHDPLRAGLSKYVKMPEFIQRKKAVLNIKNSDEHCFLWCVTAALSDAVANPERTSQYPHFNTLFNYEGIHFPISLNEVYKFEKLNNLRIHVYGIETEYFDDGREKNFRVPLYLSRNTKCNKEAIHLLMVETGLNENGGKDDDDDDDDIDEDLENFRPVFHFALIKNPSRLLSNQISKANRPGDRDRGYT